MEIILKQDVQGVGHKDEIVTVKSGYGRNYLIPKGYANLATRTAKKVHEEVIKQRAHKEEKLRSEAQAIADKISEVTLQVGAKTSSTGKIFGSVTNIQIAEAISKQGFEIDRRNINVKENAIKEIGKYNAKVKLYKDIQVDIEFEVVSE